MEREVSRVKKLPSFSLSLSELSILWDRLHLHFNDEDTLAWIDIRLNSEKLHFDNAEELTQYASNLPNKILSFSIAVCESGSNKNVFICSSGNFNSSGQVTAESSSESWCAGVIEDVYSYLDSHKLWYNSLNRAPLGYLIFTLFNAPILATGAGQLKNMSSAIGVGWLIAFLSVVLLYIFRSKLFPSMIIQVDESEGFIRKHSSLIALLLAFISLIVTTYGVFKG